MVKVATLEGTCFFLKILYQAYQYQFPKRGLLSQKRNDKRSDIVLERKPKRFGIVPEFVLLKNKLFQVGPEYVLLDQIDMNSFDGAYSGMKTQTF